MSAKPIDVSQVSPLAEITKRAFWIFATLAILSLCLIIFGNIYGERMALAGHNTNPEPVEVIIGNDVLSIPTNMIRLPEQRQTGLTDSVGIYVHWPTKQGFSIEKADSFNNVTSAANDVVFISFTVRDRFLEMNERFEPVYTKALTGPKRVVHNGLNVQALMSALGYNDEILVWSDAKNSIHPDFIARCANAANESYIAPCETDLFVGRSLEMKARFSQAMLSRWPTLKGELITFAQSLQVQIDQ